MEDKYFQTIHLIGGLQFLEKIFLSHTSDKGFVILIFMHIANIIISSPYTSAQKLENYKSTRNSMIFLSKPHWSNYKAVLKFSCSERTKKA